MLTTRQGVARAASAIVLLVTLISTGMVVAHQCHQEPVQVAAHGPINSVAPSGSLMTDICIGVTFLVLLVSGKYWLRKRVNQLRVELIAQVKDLRSFIKPPNLVFALSLPQLGISRI
jgi:hypothetical protein